MNRYPIRHSFPHPFLSFLSTSKQQETPKLRVVSSGDLLLDIMNNNKNQNQNMGIGSWTACTIVVLIHFCTVLVGAEAFDSLLQLVPQSGLVRRNNQPGPRSKRVLFVGDFGGRVDGVGNDTRALVDVWERACSFRGRARIVIPEGLTVLVHPVHLGGPCKSKLILQISGTIVAPEDPASWKGLNPRKWLYFHGINHLTVEGGGTVNGMGHMWWSQSCKRHKTNPCRHAPTAITFHKCKDLRIKNLRVVNGQQMHVAFTNCIRVAATNLVVLAPGFSPNTDGIHISTSRGVAIEDSVVRTGDDCISIVGNSSRIKIGNFVCGPGHGISIGSLGKSNSLSVVQNILVDGAFLFNTDNGVRIKTWQGGRGVAANIRFQNVFMVNVSNPIIIDQYYCDSRKPCENQTSAVKMENISFVNIRGTSATKEAIKFACSSSFPCERLYLRDIQLVSYDGGITESFCWEAHGSSQGLVYPPPCFSCDENLIKQKVQSNAIQSF